MALRALSAAGEQGLNMKQFCDAAGLIAETGLDIRLELEAAGLVEVAPTKSKAHITELRIRLTPLGREFTSHLDRAAALLAPPRREDLRTREQRAAARKAKPPHSSG